MDELILIQLPAGSVVAFCALFFQLGYVLSGALVAPDVSVDGEIRVCFFEGLVDVAEGIMDEKGAKGGLEVGEDEEVEGVEIAERGADLDGEVVYFLRAGFEYDCYAFGTEAGDDGLFGGEVFNRGGWRVDDWGIILGCR